MIQRKRKHALSNSLPMIPADEAFSYKAPETDEGWAELANIKKIDANDLVFELGREGMRKWLDQTKVTCTHRTETRITSMRRILATYDKLREPIIEGLLRVGETGNIIASPKAGKSFLSQALAMSVISGGMFLDRFRCTSGKVLMVDNELHPETIADRTRKISRALHISESRVGSMIDVMSLRGELMDLHALGNELESVRGVKLIILDSFYKFYPQAGGQNPGAKSGWVGGKFDENDNAQMAQLYTLLDSYADSLNCGIVLIHHTSKGNSSGKSVTDVGAGAGSISRACDAHIVLRPHEEAGVFVVDAANRSFPSIEPFCARFKFPVWSEAKGLDPTRLLGAKEDFGGRKVGTNAAGQSVGEDREKLDDLYETLNGRFDVKRVLVVGKDLGIAGFSFRTVQRLLKTWSDSGKITKTSDSGGSKGNYYTKPDKDAETDQDSRQDVSVNQQSLADQSEVCENSQDSKPHNPGISWPSDEKTFDDVKIDNDSEILPDIPDVDYNE